MPEPSTGGPFLRTPWRGLLFHGDSARVMRLLENELGDAINLIYADPPFAIGESLRFGTRKQARERTHGESAYRDVWQGGIAAYTAMLRERLTAMRRLLAPSGGLFLHLDWRACHHGRLLLDEIFGPENFRNEIVWHYGGRGAKAGSGQFPRNHDTILFYSKSPATRFATPHVEDRLSPEAARARGYRRGPDGRWFKTAPRGDYSDESMARLDAEGRIHRTRTGSARVKYHLPEEDGLVVDRRPLGDVWSDIPDMMHAPAAERTDYPTQKPERLLRRIVEAASPPGGLVADFFCGSGTALAAAEALGRRWVGCDLSAAAVEIAAERLAKAGPIFDVHAID